MLLFLFPRNNLPGLISNITLNAIYKFKRKIGEKEAIRPGKRFVLPIFNEEMNDIIKTIKSPEHTLVLIDDVTETVKHKIKKQESGFLGSLFASLAVSLVQPVNSSVMKCISARRIGSAERGYYCNRINF